MNKTINHLLNRREALRLLGAAGAAALVSGQKAWGMGIEPVANFEATTATASAFPNVARVVGPALFSPAPRATATIQQLSCVVKPSLTEGPYFVDEMLNRSDIRSDPATNIVKAGVPLKLRLNVSRVSSNACTPLSGALVDIWHCDALGAYSDESAGMGNPDTRGQKFLRGYQVTDSNGSVEFTTIYPGYYTGRTVHIHYKIRLFSGAQRTYDFTSQLTFDDALTDQIFTQAPYNTKAARGTRNNNDGIAQSGGSAILLSLTSDGQGGYTSTFNLGLTGLPNTVAPVSAASAASFAQGALASEAIASLFGTNLAAGAMAASTLPLPTSLGGVTLNVRDALGTERAAPLFYVSPTQINFQIPPGTSEGSAILNVLLNNTAVGQGTANIVAVAPGIFTANVSGQGIPVAIIQRVKADGTQEFDLVAQYDGSQWVMRSIDLGAAGDTVYLQLYGTGIRNRSSVSAVTVTIGGVTTTLDPAKFEYAGPAPGFAGLDQVNVILPRSLAGRGDVALILSVNGKTSNTVSLNIK